MLYIKFDGNRIKITTFMRFINFKRKVMSPLWDLHGPFGIQPFEVLLLFLKMSQLSKATTWYSKY